MLTWMALCRYLYDVVYWSGLRTAETSFRKEFELTELKLTELKLKKTLRLLLPRKVNHSLLT